MAHGLEGYMKDTGPVMSIGYIKGYGWGEGSPSSQPLLPVTPLVCGPKSTPGLKIVLAFVAKADDYPFI